jgi:pyridoxal phosphate enzyme (YggS family)
MAVDIQAYTKISKELREKNCQLVAVSKTKPVSDVLALYASGQRDFGENYVQELIEKQAKLPDDIQWHFIGHLQSNKVKFITPFVHLIHGVDSLKLLNEINKQAQKAGRDVNCLLQVHIAREETKFGFDENELNDLFVNKSDELGNLKNIRISGFMGMATFTDDIKKIREEFRYLKLLSDKFSRQNIANCRLSVLSMGMSGDYKIAIEEGSNMVRIGSLLFGVRN